MRSSWSKVVPDQVSEDVAVDALFFAHRSAAGARPSGKAAGGDWQSQARVCAAAERRSAAQEGQRAWCCSDARGSDGAQHQRHDQEALVEQQIISELCGEGMIYAGRNKGSRRKRSVAAQKTVRDMVLGEQVRIDGRRTTDIRPITTEVGLLPRVHGSALFTAVKRRRW